MVRVIRPTEYKLVGAFCAPQERAPLGCVAGICALEDAAKSCLLQKPHTSRSKSLAGPGVPKISYFDSCLYTTPFHMHTKRV
jgi:hypothetical protein